MDHFSIESMVKDGIFGSGAGIGYGEHLIPISLQFGDLKETFTWDICNPDNQPEDFSSQIVEDLNLYPALEYTYAITYEIRRQIMVYCMRKMQTFVSYYENYVTHEIDLFESMNIDVY